MILQVGLESRLHLWTCEEFNRMAESGVWQDIALELIDGAIVNMSPIGSPPSAIVSLIGQLLHQQYPTESGLAVRCQMPLMLDDSTQPQPDLAVVPGKARDYLLQHPRRAILVVEVADTSLAFDRDIKAERYGEGDVEEYWIVNLIDNQLELYRRKAGLAGFAPPQILHRGDSLSMPGLTNVALPVADLLP